MNSEESLKDRFRRAMCAYLSEEMDLDHGDEDHNISDSLSILNHTLDEFQNGNINLATLKYRMDNSFTETGYIFPPREVVGAIREVVLNIDVDEISPILIKLGAMPEDLTCAKGQLLDAEEFIELKVANGKVDRSVIYGFYSLITYMWHLQAPSIWPLYHAQLMSIFQESDIVGQGDPPQDLIEYIMAIQRVEDAVGTKHYNLIRLLPLLDEELPSEEACVQKSIDMIGVLSESHKWDRVLNWCDLLSAFCPKKPKAMYGRIAAYEAKGLTMMAIAEAESLVSLLPDDLEASRKLLSLYRKKGMVADHNREVRRIKKALKPT
ncbi:MAG: hypothetical protein GX369_07685 [Euryarchaeota archaeon]|nr:hypothetical protein [Euryarchaeota archaeon]